MLFKPFAVVAMLASAVVAAPTAADNSVPIIKSLQTIDKDIANLNNTIVKFNGNLFDAFPILGASTQLGNDLDAGTKTVNKLPTLTDAETFALIPYVNQLSADANITITTLISKKKAFDKLLLTGIIKLVLTDSKKKANTYSSAIISKVPTAYQDIAKNLVAPLDAGFQKAIDAYSQQGNPFQF